MAEVYYHRREISYERLKAALSKLSSTDFGEMCIFAYGSTFASDSNIRALESNCGAGVSLLYSGPMSWGLMRLVPLPKARVFSFEVKIIQRFRISFSHSMNFCGFTISLYTMSITKKPRKHCLQIMKTQRLQREFLHLNLSYTQCTRMHRILMMGAELQKKF